MGTSNRRDRPRGPARPTDARSADHLTLVDIVRLDMRRYGARLVRAEFAGIALIAAALTLILLAVVVTRRPMAPVGQLLLLGLGVFFAGWLLNCLTILIIACRQEVGPATPDDPDLTHRAVLRLAGLLLVPGSLPLLALRQRRRGA